MGLARHIGVIRDTVMDGGPGFAQIAVTNDCNADCVFCNFARSKMAASTYADPGRLYGAVDTLYGKGVRYIAFVGGEPLLYRGLPDVIAYAKRLGVTPFLCTNGWLLGSDMVRRLHNAGLGNVIISIDAPDPDVHDKNRGLPGLTGRIKAAIKEMGALGMGATASVTISRLVGDFGLLPPFLREMGFRDLTFSYPLRELHSSYLSYSDSGLVEYTPEELIAIFGQLKKLKRKFRILNPTAGMDEMIRFLKGEPALFPCLAGYKYFFLDWDLDVYRCHYDDVRICAVEDLGKAAPIRDDCSRCMIDCYRDPSVLQHFAVSISDGITEIRGGRIMAGGRRIFNMGNLLSIKAVVEEFGLYRRHGEL